MKAFKLLFACVLFSTAVFANGTVEPKESSSSVAVTNPGGKSVFNLYYQSGQKGLVKIAIKNEKDQIVFAESIWASISGFMRPYNFSELSAGVYTIVIEDKQGVTAEQIEYKAGKIEKLINIVKLNEDGKYMLIVKSQAKDRININVYNEFNQLIHSHSKTVLDFAEILNLKNINQFTIEVSDSQGVLKSINN
jgi:hypothetical protein